MRARFEAFLRGAPGAPALMPLAESLAPRVGSTTREAMAADATVWGSSTLRAARLLGADAALLGFDVQIAIEACRAAPGAPATAPGLARLAEAVDRLAQAERATTGIVAALCGPASLACATTGAADADALSAIKQPSTALAEALCQKRPDLLVLREGPALFAGGIGSAQRKAYNTLKNVADYFDVPLALWVEGWEPGTVADACRLKLPFLLLGPDEHGDPATPALAAALAAELEGIGLALPFADPEGAAELADAHRAALGGKACLFTSAGELPGDSDLDALRALAARLGA